jgi:hypothetical protein
MVELSHGDSSLDQTVRYISLVQAEIHLLRIQMLKVQIRISKLGI